MKLHEYPDDFNELIPIVASWKGIPDDAVHVTLDTYAEVFDRMHDDSVEKFDALMDEMDAGSGE